MRGAPSSAKGTTGATRSAGRSRTFCSAWAGPWWRSGTSFPPLFKKPCSSTPFPTPTRVSAWTCGSTSRSSSTITRTIVLAKPSSWPSEPKAHVVSRNSAHGATEWLRVRKGAPCKTVENIPLMKGRCTPSERAPHDLRFRLAQRAFAFPHI